MRTVRLIAALLLLTGFPAVQIAHAHLAGQSFEVPADGGRLIDAGCDVAVITPGQEAFCTFALIEQPTSLDWKLAPYDHVEVSVNRTGGGEESFHQSAKAMHDSMSYVSFTLKRPGPHDLSLRFLSGGTLLAERTFALVVTPEPEMLSPQAISAIIATLFFAYVGWAFVWVPLQRRRKA